ncbi:hypothetical protein PPSIR1_22209 [Plesiocystis pacifica SIR-1]|uniref:DUF2169 domain-containing protein n=1 Tax=Plesiocystis pacifica SIR-1 TaxID=391625 RepID=A6FXT9_9BACT|nr:DUF2169 domain-containing protein [Plesiocystis pacifica]EDM81677.1 hypothetical protein PPSIR1_22209 [Plesiocystis pacifica SIR-1]
MWSLRNETPFAAERSWTRDRDGTHLWLVAVKATYVFEPGGALTLADEQREPLLEPEYRGEPGRTSLRYEADLGLPKPGTDVIVNALAHSPGGVPTPEVECVLEVADLRKRVLVRGPSTYSVGAFGARPSAPEPFVTRPITYEHAYGGSELDDPDPRRQFMDPRNPVGVGATNDPAKLHGRPAPSVFYPSGNPSQVGPAGFGAIARDWSPRRELAGTYDDAWSRSRRPLLPLDYSAEHQRCAPADQRTRERLRGGEAVTLINLSPEGALRFELPRVELHGEAKLRRALVPLSFAMSSVIIDIDRRALLLVWESARPVPSKDVEHLSWARVTLSPPVP